MSEEEKVNRIQINMVVEDDLMAMHNALCVQNEHTSAQLFRWLMRQEYARRFSQPTLITITEAQEVGAR